jgi:flagellar hook-associated protein 3 FlgL
VRIADKMQYEQVKTNVGKNRSTMSELQNQAATQKRVTKPSDDPLASSRVLANRIDLQGNKQFSKSLNYAKSFLEFTDQSLGDLSELMMRAKELAISQANDGGANEDSRRAVAIEIEQLYNQMVNIGNRKLGDRFIFGGFRTQTAPFDSKGEYRGDPGEMNIHIDKEAFLAMNVPGGRVFLGAGIDRNGMAKPTTPQARSIEELDVQRMGGKTQAPAQGQGPVDSRGPASILGFQGPTPGPTPQAQAQSGAAPQVVEEASGVNLFRVIKDLEISLRTNDKAAVQETLNQLDDGLNQVVLTRAQVGSRGTVLDNFMQTLERAKVDNQITISQLEDADIFATVSDITKTENTLQATLQTSGKLIQPSLLDFLR